MWPPRTCHSSAARRRAFTLIEAIAAIVLLAVAVPPMMWAVRESHISRVNPVLASRARWLAVTRLEGVIADRYSVTRGYDWLIAGNYPAEPTISDSPGFSRSVQFSETTADLATAGNGYMNVVVSVAWTDATGQTRTLDVATVLTEFTP